MYVMPCLPLDPAAGQMLRVVPTLIVRMLQILMQSLTFVPDRCRDGDGLSMISGPVLARVCKPSTHDTAAAAGSATGEWTCLDRQSLLKIAS